jgi:outer membrane protein OmpA-like peptidoglycan-associated protein
MRIASAFIACLTAASLLACATTDKTLDTKTKKGAVLGTLAGAAAGAAIGGHEHRAGGALIGAATGALAGGLIGRYMDNQAKELDAIPGAEVTRTEDALLVNFQGQFLFDSGKSDLATGAYDRLDQLARTLNNYPKSQVRITGHTDSQGADDFNLRLSEQRADRVRDYLIHQGVSAPRISAFGMGEARPLASNATEAGRQQNRRVEIEIRPDAEVMQGEPVQ